MTAFIDHFETYLLAALEKRHKLFAFIGEHTLDLDLDSGKASFDTGQVFPFQVLGTESDNTLTWLWSWAEEQTEMADGLMASSRALRAWGEHENIPEFSTPAVDLNRADGTMISIVASMIISATCFYREPYEGGALFILLFGAPIDGLPAFTRAQLQRQIVDMAARYDFNQRRALRAYFQYAGLPATENEDTLSAELENGERVVAEFARDDKLIRWNGETIDR